MPSRSINRILATLMLLACVVSPASALVPHDKAPAFTSTQKSGIAAAKGDGSYGENQGTEFWPAAYGYRLKITDSLLALFTFLLWWSTRRLVVGADKTAARQLRAYIHVKKVEVRNFIGDPEFMIEYCNFGLTPAYSLVAWNVLEYRSIPCDRPFLIKPPEGVGGPLGVLAPSHSGHFMKKGPRQLTSEEISALQNGVAAIYFYGEFTYQDAFGKERVTRYRHVYGGPAASLPQGGSLHTAPEGNDAT